MSVSSPPATTASSAWIWMYHSIAEYEHDPHQVTVTPATFERQLAWLRRRGLRGVSIDELIRHPERRDAVGLTFDDGYADFATTAVPILRRFGFTATVYVLAARFGGTNAWDTGAPVKPLMTADQVRAVAESGMEIGSHGLRHVHLPRLAPDQLARELNHSRGILQDLIEREVTGFAYPYGDAERREYEAARQAGYDHACHACHVGHPASPTALSLPRTFIGDRDRAARLTAKRVRHELNRRRTR